MGRIEFPKKGLSDDTAFSDQPPMTTSEALNVRTIDPSTGRSRGGQRSGTTRFVSSQLDTGPVQAMAQTMKPQTPFTFSSLGSAPATQSSATGSIELTGNVTARVSDESGFNVGDQLTISDGTTSYTFEATVIPPDNQVPPPTSDPSYIGFQADQNDTAITIAGLQVAVSGADFFIGAVVDENNDSLLQLQNTNTDAGAAGNVAITVNEVSGSDFVVTGMSGGATTTATNLTTEWERAPGTSTQTNYIATDSDKNVWAVTDANQAVLYNPDGAKVDSVSPPVPLGHTMVPRIGLGDDESVYLASKADDGTTSRVWRYVRFLDRYEEKWTLDVDGSVQELHENAGLLYVVTDMLEVEDATVMGYLTGYAGLTLGSPFVAFQSECPTPTYSMQISPTSGQLLLSHPKNEFRGRAEVNKNYSGQSAYPDLWTPWDLDDYQSRLYFWVRAEDAEADDEGTPCVNRDRVQVIPDHRLSPPDGYAAVFDTTERTLIAEPAGSRREPPDYRDDLGLPQIRFFGQSGASATGVTGRVLTSNGTNSSGVGWKSSLEDTIADQTPIPNYEKSRFAVVMAIKLADIEPDIADADLLSRVIWSMATDVSGTAGAQQGCPLGFVYNTSGGKYNVGGFTTKRASLWLDVGPYDPTAGVGPVGSFLNGEVASGDWPSPSATTQPSLVNYNEQVSVTSGKFAIVTIVKNNSGEHYNGGSPVASDGRATSVIRINGRQVDSFEFLLDKFGSGNKFVMGCRRASLSQDAANEVYNDLFGGYSSFSGAFFEMITVLGPSSGTTSGSINDLDISCPYGNEGAGGTVEEGYAVSGSVASHTARADAGYATEIERIEGYLAHKYGMAHAFPRDTTGSTNGPTKDSNGYYQSHPFGGPGFMPLGPNRTNDQKSFLYNFTACNTLWTAGGELLDIARGGGTGVASGWGPEGDAFTAGDRDEHIYDTLAVERDIAYRRIEIVGNRFNHGRCARAYVTIEATPPNGETITLDDGLTTVVFEFTNGAASGGNTKVDTNVTGTDYSSVSKLIADNFVDAVNASALLINAFHADCRSDPHRVELLQAVLGSAKNTTITYSTAGKLAGDAAFSGGANDGDGWKARNVDQFDNMNPGYGSGVEIKSDDDGNLYHPERTYKWSNTIVRRRATTGTVQWRYLFAGDEVGTGVIPLGNPLSYGNNATVDGPEFVYASHETNADDDLSLQKLRVLEITEDLTALASREAVYLGVSSGSLYKFNRNGSVTAVTGGSSLFSADTPYIQSAVLGRKVFMTDGLTAHYYDVDDDEVKAFTSDTRSVPPKRFRLIASWRNRLVVARIPGDDTNWYMSRSGDPFDWDETPSVVDAQQPVSGNISKGRVGEAPDVINCLIPWSDDLLIIGGDRSILRMTGDPMQGAQLDLVSDSIGIAFLSPYCKDPDGTVFFFGSRGGVWAMPPGGLPTRITISSIERRMQALALDEYRIEMVWNYYDEGLHVIPVPYDLASDSLPKSWFFDAKHGSWWEDSWQDSATGIRSVLLADGDQPDDRRVLLGCRDGRVRYVDPNSETDDGVSIDSQVLIGPLAPEAAEVEARFHQLTSVLGTELGGVTWEILTGEDAESAQVVGSGRWVPGRNPISSERWVGPACWIRLRSGSNNAWALESLSVTVTPTSRKRVR